MLRHQSAATRRASARRTLPAQPALTGLAILALVAGACGPTASGSPSTSTPPASSPPASATPSAAPSPEVDVTEAFLETVTDPALRGTADVTGTVAFGTFEGDAEGVFEFDGGDSHTLLTLSIAGQDQTNETIDIGQEGWKRTDDGPWVPEDPADDEGQSLSELLTSILEIEDTGVETRDGRELHHLELADGGEIPPEAMGIDTTEIRDPRFTMEFYAEPDGTPAIMTVVGTWTQSIDDQDVDAEMDLDFAFRDLGEAVDIEEPDEVWEVYTSESFGYSMAHPPGWTVISSNTEDQYQLDGVAYIYVAPQDIPAGMDLAGLRDALLETYAGDFGGEPDAMDDARLHDEPAVRLVYHPSSGGNDLAFVDYAAIHEGQAWEVFIVTAAGSTEAADVALFEDFVSTFAFE